MADEPRRLLELARRRRAGVAHARAPRDTFPPELEPRLAERPAPFSMHRSAAWLDWVRPRELHGRHSAVALYLVTTSGGRAGRLRPAQGARLLLGHEVEPRALSPLGSLVDWRIFEPSAVRLEQLVLLAVEASSTTGTSPASRCAFRPSTSRARLGRLGFLPAGAQHVVSCAAWREARSPRPQAREARAWSAAPRGGRPCLLVSSS